MTSRAIKLSSRALGKRDHLTVRIYDTVEELRTAATRFNGHTSDEDNATLGVTQLARNEDWSRVWVTVRLARGYLSTQIVAHELHHATAAIYGASLGKRIDTRAHLNHHNEPFAHLFSDFMHHLVDRMYALGYYPST